MKNIKITIIFISFAVALILTEKVMAQYAIKQSVLGNGGTALNNGGHRLVGTVGQPGIGRVSSAIDIHKAGFWYQAGNVVTSIESMSNFLPDEFSLEQNFPNPFNPSTTIEFSLPKPAFVTLKVYNLLGEEVATLVAEQRPAGIHRFYWNVRGLASGVYLYRLEAGNYVQSKKLILMQ
jgi:hypothetical protein